MTKNQEGLDPNAEELPGSANPVVSEGEESNLSEQNTQVVALEKKIEVLQSEIRGLQGKLDKDADAAAKKLQDQITPFLQELGIELTPEQQRKKEIIDLRTEISKLKQPQTGNVPANAQPSVPAEYAKVFKTLGIEEPTPEDIGVAMKYSSDPIKMTAELVTRKLNKPTPNPAAAIAPGNTGSAGGATSLDALYAEFRKLDGLHYDKRLPNGKTVAQNRAELVKKMEELENK